MTLCYGLIPYHFHFKKKLYIGTRGGFIMLQVARISTNPSSNSVSNSFNQLILETLSQKKNLETCMMKMTLKIECIGMEEPV